jgi:hypothetical protein
MSEASRRDLFAHTSLNAFLAAFLEQKRQSDSRFSLGAWAQRLGVSQTATISRVVKGERKIGNDLADKLIAYFRFTTIEAEYFRCLVAAERADSGSKALLHLEKRMNELRASADTASSVMGAYHAEALVEMHADRMVTLFGQGNSDAVKRLLSDRRMEAVSRDGRCMIGLAVTSYRSTFFPAFRMATLCVHAKRAGAEDALGGFYYPEMFSDNFFLYSFGDRMWGNVYQRAAIDLDAGAPLECFATVKAKGRSLMSLKMAEHLELAPSPFDIDYTNLSNKPGGQKRALLRTTSTSYRRPFDSSRDLYESGGHVGRFLEAAGFEPLDWQISRDFRAKLYPPQSI